LPSATATEVYWLGDEPELGIDGDGTKGQAIELRQQSFTLADFFPATVMLPLMSRLPLASRLKTCVVPSDSP